MNLSLLPTRWSEAIRGPIGPSTRRFYWVAARRASDCGMKYLPRDVAFGKLCALVEGARLVRAEIGGEA